MNYKSIPRHITTNISEQQFVQTIRILKITEGDMFQVVPSKFIVINTIFNTIYIN